MREVLKLPAYRRLLAAYTLTQLAWSVGTLALAVLVYRRTGSALGSAGFFLAAQFVPALLSPALVAHLDRLPVRRVLPCMYALEAVAFAAFAFLAAHFSLAPLLILAALDGIVALAARSITRAATAAVTTPVGLLRAGNALINGAFSVCFFVGPAIAAVVADARGTQAALLLNAGMFVIIAAILASARGLPQTVPSAAPTAGRLRAALEYAWRHPYVRTLLGIQAVALVAFTISVPVEVVFAVHTLHAGRGGYAALLSAWGAGTVVGSIAYARWRWLPGRTQIVIGTIALGAGFVLMAIAPALGVAIAGAAIAGTGNGIEAVAARTTLQEHVAPEWMALVMSLNESLFQAMPGIGILIGGIVTAVAGTRIALAVAGGMACAVAAIAWVALAPRSQLASSSPSPAPAARR